MRAYVTASAAGLFFTAILLCGHPDLARGEVNCGKASFEEVGRSGSTYTFSATVSCESKDSFPEDGEAFKEALVSYWKDSRQYTVKKMEDNITSGWTCELKDSYETLHGKISILSTGTLHKKGRGITLESTSEQITGDGNTKYTKGEKNSITLEADREGSGGHIDITRIVQIEKPWCAPKNIFFKRVKKEVGEILRNVARAYLLGVRQPKDEVEG